jgi:hypothetical protein
MRECVCLSVSMSVCLSVATITRQKIKTEVCKYGSRLGGFGDTPCLS